MCIKLLVLYAWHIVNINCFWYLVKRSSSKEVESGHPWNPAIPKSGYIKINSSIRASLKDRMIDRHKNTYAAFSPLYGSMNEIFQVTFNF